MRLWVRISLIIAGWLAVVLGFIGIFLPILPTTPFLLLAATCFAKSSQRFHNWLLHSPVFGKIISDWQKHRRVNAGTKRWAIFSILITFSLSIYIVPLMWVKYLLATLMLICLVGIYRAPGDSPFAKTHSRHKKSGP